MARSLTTREQLSGWRLQIKRVENGCVRRTNQLIGTPQSSQLGAFFIGCGLSALIVVAGLLINLMFPKAAQNGASMIVTKSGGAYVMYDDALHPYLNLASARLIVGKPDPPKVVKDDALAGQPRGLPMGIPAAGLNDLIPRTDDTALWAVCDKHTDTSELSLTRTDVLSTTLFAGVDSITSAVTPLRDSDAIVVQLSGSTEQWLVYKGQRTSIGVDDMATRAALGLTPAVAAKATPISRGLLDAIPAAPAVTVPFIPDRGKPSPTFANVAVGDVIITESADGTRQYHVALADGAEGVPELVAQLLLNTGSKEITTVDRSAVAKAAMSNVIDVTHYPDVAPTFTQPNVVCWQWRKGERDLKAATTILTGESLPVERDNLKKVVALLKSPDPDTTANASYMAPGKGWFVRVTGSESKSHAKEQLLWIEDTGIRYFIGMDDQNKYDSVVHALGIGVRDPLPIPWAVATLYAPGATLSKDAALTYHGGESHVDLGQHVAPSEKAAADHQ